MSRDLNDLLQRTADEPTRPLDTAAVVGRARRQMRLARVGAGLGAVAVIAVASLVALPLVNGGDLGLEIADGPDHATESAAALAVPEPGLANPAHLEDGTAVFVSHLESGELVVLDATSPDNQSLLAFCERGGGLEDPRHGSRFTADGTWLGGPSPTGLASYPYEYVGDDRIRVTGPAGQAPPRPADESVTSDQIPRAFCFDTETGDFADRARYHQPDQPPPSGAFELSSERWQWIRADLEARDGTLLLCQTAPCGTDAIEVPAPYGNWVQIFTQDDTDQLLLARLNEHGTVDVRLPVPESSSDSSAGSCVREDIQFVDEEPSGEDTVEEAINDFATGNDFLADVTFDGERIIYQGEVVGQVVVSSTSEGGYVVTSAEWCYPDDY